jgi:hypothetical protein
MMRALHFAIDCEIFSRSGKKVAESTYYKLDASRRAEKCRSLRVQVEVGVPPGVARGRCCRGIERYTEVHFSELKGYE